MLGKWIRKVKRQYAEWKRPWQVLGTFNKRHYTSYDDYIEHQRSKLELIKERSKRSKHLIDLKSYDVTYREVLRGRLEQLPFLQPGTSVLCLAARIGTEVKAFIDVGCFALGLDLNPGPSNAYVVVGDFHNLQFADASVDVVFTNSLDHVFNLEAVIAEVIRVLKPGGRFIAEITAGQREGYQPKDYECFIWDKIDDLVAQITALGLFVESQNAIKQPWQGRQVVFQKPDA